MSGVGSVGSYGNRPASSFALDPPHMQQQQQPLRSLFPTASGPASGSGSGPSGGAAAVAGAGYSKSAALVEWQQQVAVQ